MSRLLDRFLTVSKADSCVSSILSGMSRLSEHFLTVSKADACVPGRQLGQPAGAQPGIQRCRFCIAGAPQACYTPGHPPKSELGPADLQLACRQPHPPRRSPCAPFEGQAGPGAAAPAAAPRAQPG